MNPLKMAVIGVGYLGKFHAEKYANLDNVSLVAVCDINKQTCNKIATQYGVAAVTNYQDLIGKVDAVSIAVPTLSHHEIAKEFLSHGVHVLVEKPITKTVEQAKELVKIAKEKNCILQVGHLERFNSARIAMDDYLDNPMFIESHRLAPFKPRGTDVNVVLELMIHDIDIIQSIVNSPIKSLDAQGAPVLSKFVDIANARISFENGCVANVTASRISFKTERKTRIFQPNSYISVDFQNKKFAVFRKGEGEMFPGIPEITRQETVFDKSDALKLEIEAFIDSIIHNKKPLVSGEEGCNALETASEITRLIRANLAKTQKDFEQSAALSEAPL